MARVLLGHHMDDIFTLDDGKSLLGIEKKIEPDASVFSDKEIMMQKVKNYNKERQRAV